MTNELDNAKKLFKHYFKVAFEESGVDWDSDYSVEIDEAIDSLVSVFDSKIKEMEEKIRILKEKVDNAEDGISDLRMSTENY